MHQQLNFLQDNYFDHSKVLTWEQMPLPDEPFVAAWEEYINDASRLGVLEALSRRLVQLRFPVQEGISTNPNYRLATRRGLPTASMPEATGAKFEDPSGLKVYLYQTLAGKIPVIETSNRNDFVTLVRIFSYRNEPVAIPASMGACMIKGYNNWDRVAKYRRKMGADFDFKQMQAQKELYQDAFLILTDNEYSGVPAAMLGLTEADWQRLSMIIRREHEATHYFTLRMLGSAKNHLLDEFIADYMGIVAAAGKYRADWFLCFMGLENYPAFRPGGRLTNYLKNVEMSEQAFRYLLTLIKSAAENVEKIGEKYAEVYSDRGKYQMLLQLTKTNLVELAAEDAGEIMKSLPGIIQCN